MTVGTNTIADIALPVPVVDGGTGLATTIAYGLLTGGTTSTGAIQNIGAGTTNYVPVSGGASALAAWTNNDAIGGWQLINTVTIASTTATASFTGLSTAYYMYKIIVSAIYPITNAANLIFLVSSNNGVSYDNSAANYGYACKAGYSTSSTTTYTSASATGIQIGGAFSSTAYANNFEITMLNPATSTVNNGIYYYGWYFDSTNSQSAVYGEGTRLATQINNAVQFLFSSGNIANCTIKLYGILV